MPTNINKHFCIWCAEPADDYIEDYDGNRAWVCEKIECRKEIEKQLRKEVIND